MADWKKILSRGEVEDRRAMSPVIVSGGLTVAGVALFLVVNYLNGGSMTTALQQVGQAVLEQQSPISESPQTSEPNQFVGEDSYEVFASTVLGSTNDAWDKIFASQGLDYPQPKLVLFRDSTKSDCGVATSQVGPHYCELDATIYLDETFFDEMINRFGATGSDLSQAYVIAHEVGHHVQKVLGTLDQVSRSDNQVSVKLELQADCYAGIWAFSIRDQGILAPGEIREAMDAAASVGDDRIQEKVQGYINPETFTHGTSDERVSWFTAGYEQGNPDTCDTFD